MKYIFSIALMVFVFNIGNAQYLYNAYSADTITNTEADTLTWDRTFTPAHFASCHCEYTELSGTSNVNQYLEGSQDNGTTWFQIDLDTIVSGVASAHLHQFSSYLLNNAARYRVRLVGEGTQSLRYKCSLAVRRE